MSNDVVGVTPGTGKNVAGYGFTEDAITKIAQRIALNDSAGGDIMGLLANPAWTTGDPASLVALWRAIRVAVDAVTAAINTSVPVLGVQPMMANGAALGTLAFTEAVIAESTSGDRTIVAAVSGQTTKVYRMILQAGATGLTVLVKDGAGTTLMSIVLAANQGFVLDFSQYPWFTTTANTAFILNLSASVALNGRLYYVTSV